MRNILIAAALSFPLAVSIPLTVQADELIVRGDRLFIHAEVNGRKAEALLDSGFSEVDYAELRDAETLEPLSRIGTRPARLLVAARIGPARLIDNMAIG